MPPRKRKPRVDLPANLSDETAAEILDFLHAITDAFESRYFAQIHRYYDNLRADMMNSSSTQPHHIPDPNDPDTDPF